MKATLSLVQRILRCGRMNSGRAFNMDSRGYDKIKGISTLLEGGVKGGLEETLGGPSSGCIL